MADIRAELWSKTTIRASMHQATGAAGAKKHSQLTGRDALDQHPMSAITGLVDALAKKSDGMEVTDEGLVYLTAGGELIAGPYGPFGDDYALTPEDKQEITRLVLAALPTWTGGAY